MIETTQSISSAPGDVSLERRVWMRISGNLSVSEEGDMDMDVNVLESFYASIRYRCSL